MPIQPITGQIKAQPLNDNFSFLESKISNIGNASPKGTYDTLADLQNAFPNGSTGIYVVLANGNWYYWNGTAWTSGGVYQSTGLANRSVSFQKLDIPVVKRTYSLDANKKVNSQSLFDTPQENLFNKNTVTMGFYLINGVPTASPGNGYSDYISVKTGSSYWITRILTTDGGEFCDDNFNFVQKIVGDGTNILTIPANVSYIRLNISPSNSPLETFMVVEGTTQPKIYKEHHVGEIDGLIVKSDHINGGMYPEQFSDIEILNLFDKNTATPNKGVSDTNGNLVDSQGVYASRFIRVNPGDILGCTNNFTSPGGFYTIEKTWVGKINFIEAEMGWYTVIVPEGVYLARVNATQSSLNSYMLTKSATKPKAYSPYRAKLSWLEDSSNSFLRGKNVLCIGDSITWLDGHTTPGYDNGNTVVIGYQEQFRKEGATVTSQGNSGATYRQYDPSISDMEHGSIYDDIVTNAYDVTPYDIITLFGGTNDVGRGLNLGTLGNESDTSFDPKTTIGALRGIVEYIRANNPSCEIYIITPLRSGLSSRPYDKMEQVTQGILEVAKMYSVPYIDMLHEGGIGKLTYSTFTYDNLHPNNEGFERIGSRMVRYINSK